MLSRFQKMDWILAVSMTFLCGFGLIALYSIFFTPGSATLDTPFLRQVLFIVLGVAFFIGLMLFDYRHIRSYSTALYFLSLILLLSLEFFGVERRGTVGWLDFGPFSFQPIEVVKILFIIFLAHFFSKKHEELGDHKVVVVSFVVTALVILLTLRQPDFGSAAVVFGIWLGMLFATPLHKRYFGIIIGLALVGAVAGWFFLADYQQERVRTFLNPQRDPSGAGYNVIQSITAVGSGGLFGTGVGAGSQSHLYFLPEQHTDFIFAVIVEEFGFVGGIAILVLFFVALTRLRAIALASQDRFGYFFIIGVIMLLLLHMTVNVGMNIGLLPVTGIPLPFISYGGSALLSVFIALGIAQSIYRRRKTNFLPPTQDSF